MILCAGGILSNFVLVAMIWFIGTRLDSTVYPSSIPISNMSAGQTFRDYLRFVGVGAIAAAGIFGIAKSLRSVAGAIGIALRVFRKSDVGTSPERVDRDISTTTIFIGVQVAAVTVGVYRARMPVTWTVILIGTGMTVLFSFFFTSVAVNAIATVARNPVSGMTMLTVILSCVVLLVRPVGDNGHVLCDGNRRNVCTALSVSGQAITDLKTGTGWDRCRQRRRR